LALFKGFNIRRIEAKAPLHSALPDMNCSQLLRIDMTFQRFFADLQPFSGLVRRQQSFHCTNPTW
jgi:hypothetical protein